MRRDHRPYYVKKLWMRLQALYTKHFIRPQVDNFGKGVLIIKPWHIELFGYPIEIGDFGMMIATSDKKIRLSVWSNRMDRKGIRIGKYCLMSPGVRISAASEITIGDNSMLASGVYITDSDWHGIYDRVSVGETLPVTIASNVWIGDSSIICKGVTIGENSIVGAGSVVTKDIPPNVIAAGNPAKPVKELHPEKGFYTRSQWLANPSSIAKAFDQFDQANLMSNSMFHWMRHLIYPMSTD